MFAEITDKLSHKKQKVKALHEATEWYKRLLSMRCEYSDGKYICERMKDQQLATCVVVDFALYHLTLQHQLIEPR